MLRAIAYLLFSVILISVLRMVIGIVAKIVAQALATSQGRPTAKKQPFPKPKSPAPFNGELKRDPVCGTFVAEQSSIKQQIGNQTFHYCSQECRERHSLVAH